MRHDLSCGTAENLIRSTHCGETYTIKKYSTDGRPNFIIKGKVRHSTDDTKTKNITYQYHSISQCHFYFFRNICCQGVLDFTHFSSLHPAPSTSSHFYSLKHMPKTLLSVCSLIRRPQNHDQ